jgi:hypothetical protein
LEKSTTALLTRLALPAVLLSENERVRLLVMAALPAVLVLRNCIVAVAPPVLVMLALPAVLVLRNTIVPLPLFVMLALPPLITMPAPLNESVWLALLNV